MQRVLSLPGQAQKKATMKTITSAHGHDVRVSHVVSLKTHGIHEIRIEATVGGIVQGHTVTMAPIDSSGPRGTIPTTEQIQMLVDARKAKLVDEVSWKYGLTKSLEGLT